MYLLAHQRTATGIQHHAAPRLRHGRRCVPQHLAPGPQQEKLLRDLPPLRLLRFTQFLLKLSPAAVEVSVLPFHLRKLVGKQVVAVVNLAPRKIAGIESQGMILSAVDDEDNLRLMSVGEGVEDGAIIG